MICLASPYTHSAAAPSAAPREEERAGAQAKMVPSRGKTKEAADLAVRPSLPVLRVRRDELAVVTPTPREYLPLNGCEILNAPFRELREANITNLRVHMVNIVACFPKSFERLFILFRDEFFFDEMIDDFRPTHLYVQSEAIAFSDKPADSLGDRLGHHDGAIEVPVCVKEVAFNQRLREMVIGGDLPGRDFKVAVDTFLNRRLEEGAQILANHKAPDTLWNARHDASSFRSLGAVVSTRVGAV